ncbi:hypothetical protein BHE74_00040615, partial [Ensete ventricosum]
VSFRDLALWRLRLKLGLPVQGHRRLCFRKCRRGSRLCLDLASEAEKSLDHDDKQSRVGHGSFYSNSYGALVPEVLITLLLTMPSYFVAASMVLAVRCAACSLPLGNVGLAPLTSVSRVVSIRRRRDCINSRETTDPPFISITGRKSWPSTLDPADRRVARSTRRARRCRQFRALPPHAEVRRGQSHSGDVAGNMCWARLSPDRSLSSSATPYRPLIKPRSSQLRSLCSALWTSFRRYREAIGGFPITYPGFPVTVNRFACSLNRRSSIDSIWFAANGV